MFTPNRLYIDREQRQLVYEENMTQMSSKFMVELIKKKIRISRINLLKLGR